MRREVEEGGIKEGGGEMRKNTRSLKSEPNFHNAFLQPLHDRIQQT